MSCVPEAGREGPAGEEPTPAGVPCPYLPPTTYWTMHSPWVAQGRWKLRSQPISLQVMAAPLPPQTTHSCEEHRSLPQQQPQHLRRWLHGPGQGAECTRGWRQPPRLPGRGGSCAAAAAERLGPRPVPPSPVERAGICAPRRRLSSREPLLAQISLFLSGAHPLSCQLDGSDDSKVLVDGIPA